MSADVKLMTVPVSTTTGLELGKPTVLFDAAVYFFGGQGRNYDIAPDGKRFVMVKDPTRTIGNALPITVVVNWVEELRARVK